MKKLTILSFLFACAISTTGCHRVLHHESSNDPDNLSGIWSGDVTVGGRTQNIHFNIQQNGSEIQSGYASIDYSGTLKVKVTGSVEEHVFNMVSNYRSSCPNTITFSGENAGGALHVNINTDGNPSCNEDPIHESIWMKK